MNRNDTGDLMTHLPITPPGGKTQGFPLHHHAKPSRFSLLLAAAFGLGVLSIAPAQAATLQFSRIGAGDQGLQQFWQLTPEETQRYRNIMAATGERYKNATPLMVLSMMADSPADRDYYAKKAAEMEHALVMRELETATLVSQHMSDPKLVEEMTLHTDRLTGLDTAHDVPDYLNPEWREDDWLVVYVDGSCITARCLGQFAARVRAVDEKISRFLIINSRQPLDAVAQQVADDWHAVVQRYDPVEHGRFLTREQAPNAVLHVRGRRIIETLGDSSPGRPFTHTAAPVTDSADTAASNTQVANDNDKAAAKVAPVPDKEVSLPAPGEDKSVPVPGGKKTPSGAGGKTGGNAASAKRTDKGEKK